MIISQLQQHFKTDRQDAYPTEESILLRVLVQILVSIGIIATDVAAQTHTSFLAIPLSLVGTSWSWHHRKKRNIGAKFLIAIGMLLVLAIFLGNMVVNLQDSRVALAKLLIELQVLHSFDLPRRKDLGYSMVIGLILIGVAGTISQTLAFAPWLLLFLVFALPTLVLDYRSRLGLGNSDRRFSFSFFASRSLKYSPLSPRRFTVFVLTIVVLGLGLFAIMPRFQGYQIQTFPVSSPAEFENREFDTQNRDIINPGYVKEGDGSQAGNGLGNTPTEGPGAVDPTFYSGFNRKMNQNLRGTMKSKVVMRVRSQAPGFWRVLAFDRYTGQGWEISRDDKLEHLQRSPWSYRFFINFPFTKAKTKQVIQSYSLVSELPNLIPVLPYAQYIFFPTKEIALDPENSLRSPGGLIEGLTYTVISQVPYRDRTLLNRTSENYSDFTKTHYLQIPPEIAEKVRNQAEVLLSKSSKPITTVYEKALFLAQALKQNYEIQSDLPFLAENEDLTTAFLFKYKGGYRDHFSTVLTVMLRSLGIPTRLSVGFASGQFNPFTGYYIVHNTDAYALPEVYFPDYGWFAFDPIPGHDLVPLSFEESQTFSVLKQFWQWVAGWIPSPIMSFLSILWNNVIGFLGQILGSLWKFVSSSLIGALVGLILAVFLGFLGWLGGRQVYHWSDCRKLAKLPPMARLYRQMLRILAEKGYAKHPTQTPLEFAFVMRQQHSPIIASIVEEISQAYVRWLYGEKPPNLAYLRQKLRNLLKIIRS